MTALATPLWEHQRRAVDLITRQDATMLIHEMGTGKTLTTIAYIAEHRPGLTLIVCPKPIVPVWPRQFRQHLGLPKQHGIHVVPLVARKTSDTITDRLRHAEEARAAARRSGWPCVLVVNYEAVWREPMGSEFLKWKWDLVVLDESHRIKAKGGKASRYFRRLGTQARKRVALTGTPMPHSPLDVYGQYRFLDPRIFGTNFQQFQWRYAELDGHHVNGRPVQVLGYRHMDELHGKVFSIADRVKKEEVLDLPEQLHVEHLVPLGPKAQRAYDQLEHDFITEVDSGVVTAANALVKIIRLAQVTSGFVRTEDGIDEQIDTAKADALTELLEDVDPKEPVVVFCHFRRDLDAVSRVAQAAGRPFYELSGRVNDIGAKWEPKPGGLAAVQIQAGKEGIDLTASNVAIYWSQTYKLGDFEQSLARLHRPGQRHNVTFIHLLAENTIDQRIRKALEQRQEVVESVLRGYNQKGLSK